MAIIKWEPFGEIDRFFDGFPNSVFTNINQDMAVDLYEDGNNLIAEMSLSGIKPEDVDITVEGDYLRIVGTREEKEEKKEKQFYSKEIRRGSFERVINLPDAVDEKNIEAEYEDGILKVIMPKLTEENKEKTKIIVKKK